MYCRCGSVSKAREVFDSVMEPNVVTWTTMISGYAMNGYGREALELFQLMQRHGFFPNDVTFVAVLAACSHSGLVQEGREVFKQMKNFGVTPGLEHHVCMVDMLGRTGLLDEAFQYIMDLYPNASAPPLWTALMGACKTHRNYVIGVQAAEYLLSIE
ncbi:hypothetical protein LIER_08980 [Lithospermum erythrorhizon]|uniref:Pentatricopeptide repeat-containing protein n=1 Tax=Lithospermum erythrorhizon TaxID=34254 RepID=A0AAV3PG71_LITER